VHAREPPALDVVHRFRPFGFALANEQGVSVLGRFGLHERGVDAPHHHWNAARPELLGDAVGPWSLRRERRQSDEVRINLLVIERTFALLVDELDLPVLRRRSRDVGECQRLPQIVAVQRYAVTRIDENELLHAAASTTASSRPTCSKIASARSMFSEV